MKLRLLLILACISPVSLLAQERVKCEANVNGFKIHTVYIIGSQPNGVAWAYKHIGEATCLTPVTDPTKADAILEIVPNGIPSPAPGTPRDAPLSISCSSSGGSSTCLDSDGNELTVDCGRNGCISYYGPSPALLVLHSLKEWANNAWYQSEARLFTQDHKLIWKSEDQKGHFPDLWPDKLLLGTNTPHAECRKPRMGYKNFRQWSSEHCGVDFDPLVSIDLKLEARKAEAAAKLSAQAEMKLNAEEAARQQAASKPNQP